MQVSIATPILLLCIGACLAWVGYTLGIGDLQKWLLTVITVVEFGLVSWCYYNSLKHEDPRTRINQRVVISCFITLTLCMNFVFSFFAFSAVAICVPNLVLMLLLLILSININH